ncbi:MAG: glycosyltransferase family 2 protein [Prevotella sp.]|nr:glycosyltransferase family 2 protein [Prevotella sp.]
MKKDNSIQLSILIPAYNYACTALVRRLHGQAVKAGIEHEIIVADDGSTDESAIEANRQIDGIESCTYIIRGVNVGRAAIRNYLAGRSRYGRLLFLDCDMELPDDSFIERYAAEGGADIVDGGIRIGSRPAGSVRNIRFEYEHAAEPHHTAAERARRPFRSFRTTNFMISREAMDACPFDERFRHYGYEDVLFGKELERLGFAIRHIDNPTVLTDFETNDVFISKTEEAMRTLCMFRNELQGYSHLLDIEERLRSWRIAGAVRMWHRMFGRAERRLLVGGKAGVRTFDIYRLGYFMCRAANE